MGPRFDTPMTVRDVAMYSVTLDMDSDFTHAQNTHMVTKPGGLVQNCLSSCTVYSQFLSFCRNKR